MNEVIESNVVKRVILVINENRGSLISKLSKYNDLIEIVYIYQRKNNYKEYLCAMKNAEDYMLEYNVLLLPDTYIERLSILITQSVNFMDYTLEPVVVFAKKENNLDILRDEGAIKLNKYDKLIEMEEKPTIENANKFNGFWVSYIFKSSYLNKILNLFSFSDIDNDFFPITCFLTEYACDLGDWNRLNRFYGTRFKDE